eukprot:6212927-Pleurochrysis_carterae.AAC.4
MAASRDLYLLCRVFAHGCDQAPFRFCTPSRSSTSPLRRLASSRRCDAPNVGAGLSSSHSKVAVAPSSQPSLALRVLWQTVAISSLDDAYSNDTNGFSAPLRTVRVGRCTPALERVEVQ